jgi:hypothetical protein
VINGIQVLPVELDLEARVRVQRRNEQISHNYRTRMGLSHDADHENIFSDLTLGSGDETDEHERS